MVRFNLDLIERSQQSVNAAGRRELTLRGNHIEVLENLGATKDLYETLDFTDNNLIKVARFPPLGKLKVLVLSSNSISRL